MGCVPCKQLTVVNVTVSPRDFNVRESSPILQPKIYFIPKENVTFLKEINELDFFCIGEERPESELENYFGGMKCIDIMRQLENPVLVQKDTENEADSRTHVVQVRAVPVEINLNGDKNVTELSADTPVRSETHPSVCRTCSSEEK